MNVPFPEIVHIHTGYQFRKGVRDHTESGASVGVLQLRDIDDGELNLEGIEYARMKKPEPYLLRQGDVLLMTRGQQFAAILVSTGIKNIIASHFFLILRVRDPDLMMPSFLAWQLNHPHTQAALKIMARQTHIPFISRSDIESFSLAVPPLHLQKKVAALDDLRRQEARLTTELMQKREQLIDAVTLELVSK